MSSPVLPLIALVGRPNVGKSTLFNRLTRTRRALVDDTPGLTRDRQYGEATWGRRRFRLVDTGGFAPDPGESLNVLIRSQAEVAIQEAEAVILVLDGKHGPMPDDYEIAALLRKSGKPVVCAVNKAEGRMAQEGMPEFHALGLHPLLAISAEHGMGVEELVEETFRLLPRGERDEESPLSAPMEEEGIRVAIIGCPNAGKSSLVNRLLGEDRQIVSDIPGTTRDSVDLPLVVEGKSFILVDTAGIRRKNRVTLRVEKYSVIAALKSIDRAEVALLVLDAERGLTDQDKRVAGYALERGCGVIFAVNKWDRMPSGDRVETAFKEELRGQLPTLAHAPVYFISAMTGRQTGRLLPAAARMREAVQRRISTGALNRWLAQAVDRTPPPRAAGRLIKIRYVTQVASAPPTMAFFCNLPEAVPDSYKKYLENQLRQAFDFTGVPIRMFFRGGENPYAVSGEKGRGPARGETPRERRAQTHDKAPPRATRERKP